MAFKLREVVEILNCKVICCEERIDEIDVRFGCAADLMSDVLAFSGAGSLLLTGLTSAQSVRTADIAEVCAIVFVRGKLPTREAVELALRKGLPLLSTESLMYEAAGMLYAKNLMGR